jgi:hypothetical protein
VTRVADTGDGPAEVTVIVHACRWPDRQQLAGLLETIEQWDQRVEVVEAREEAHAAVGAAALVNRAARSAHGRLLLCLQPHVAWTPAQLDTVRAGAEAGLCRAWTDQSASPPEPALLWGIPRLQFERAGGLDPRFWSVGEVDDLEARLRVGGIPTRRVTMAADSAAPESYPLKPEVRRFLALRNPLLTAFKALPADELGRLLSLEAPAALERAWRVAGIDAASFRMGATAVPSERQALADEAGVLIPLLALDSALSEHVADRRR